MANEKRVIHWDGSNFPEELKAIPPGEYFLEPLVETRLTDKEEQGILKAIGELDAGQGKSLAEVVAEIRLESHRVNHADPERFFSPPP